MSSASSAAAAASQVFGSEAPRSRHALVTVRDPHTSRTYVMPNARNVAARSPPRANELLKAPKRPYHKPPFATDIKPVKLTESFTQGTDFRTAASIIAEEAACQDVVDESQETVIGETFVPSLGEVYVPLSSAMEEKKASVPSVSDLLCYRVNGDLPGFDSQVSTAVLKDYLFRESRAKRFVRYMCTIPLKFRARCGPYGRSNSSLAVKVGAHTYNELQGKLGMRMPGIELHLANSAAFGEFSPAAWRALAAYLLMDASPELQAQDVDHVQVLIPVPPSTWPADASKDLSENLGRVVLKRQGAGGHSFEHDLSLTTWPCDFFGLGNGLVRASFWGHSLLAYVIGLVYRRVKEDLKAALTTAIMHEGDLEIAQRGADSMSQSVEQRRDYVEKVVPEHDLIEVVFEDPSELATYQLPSFLMNAKSLPAHLVPALSERNATSKGFVNLVELRWRPLIQVQRSEVLVKVGQPPQARQKTILTVTLHLHWNAYVPRETGRIEPMDEDLFRMLGRSYTVADTIRPEDVAKINECIRDSQKEKFIPIDLTNEVNRALEW